MGRIDTDVFFKPPRAPSTPKITQIDDEMSEIISTKRNTEQRIVQPSKPSQQRSAQLSKPITPAIRVHSCLLFVCIRGRY